MASIAYLNVISLLLLATTSRVASQNCFQQISCDTCTSSGLDCSWCPGGFCSIQGACGIVSPDQCPQVIPLSSQIWSRAFALGILSLAAVAIFALLLFVYSPVERLCGLRASTAVHTVPPPAKRSVHTLFVASVALWLGASLAIATPIVPWIASRSANGGVMIADAFNFYSCPSQSTPLACQQFSYRDYSILSTNLSSEMIYFNGAITLGVLAYIFIICCLTPATVMTSLATYRLHKFIRYGIPPHSSGCSSASLAVSNALGWIGCAGIAVIWLASIILCHYAIVNNLNMLFNTSAVAEFATLPGIIIGALALAFSIVGYTITSLETKQLQTVNGIGSSSVCCVRCCATTVRVRNNTYIVQDAFPNPLGVQSKSYGRVILSPPNLAHHTSLKSLEMTTSTESSMPAVAEQELATDTRVPFTAQSTASVAVTTNVNVFCRGCGNRLQQGYRFCSSCGLNMLS